MNYQSIPTEPVENRPEPLRDTPGVIVFPPLLYLGILLLGLVLRHAWKWPLAPASVPALWLRIIGAIIFVSGFALFLSGRAAMVRAGTNIPPFRPALKIVTNGPFRFTRNPLYTGNSLVYVGLTFLLNSTWMLILFVPMVLLLYWGIVLREERYLEAKFGEEYTSYKARVRRWL